MSEIRYSFVSSDTHLSHRRILTLCGNRLLWPGVTDIESHDRAIIKAWQAVVGPDDWVLHLGDFALTTAERTAWLRSQLPGHIMLCLGNHDRTATSLRGCGFDLVCKGIQHILPDGRTFSAMHDPAGFRPDEAENADVLLHGHWHGGDHRSSEGVHPAARAKLMDCGVDVWGPAPVPLELALAKNAP